MIHMKEQLYKIIPALTLLALLSSCATNPVTGKQDFMMISEEQEINLGKQYHQEILKQYKLYDDPQLQAYVTRLGEELAQKSHRNNLFYHFYVIDSPIVNAFALPGGYIYISRGILSYMNSESELAGVLGHELGHVTARHSAKAISKQQLTGIFATAAVIATGTRVAGDLSSILGSAVLSGYGRAAELESDRLGAEYIAAVGYDPDDMIEVIGILKNQEEFEKQRAIEEDRPPRAYHGVFASHPRNDDRLQEVISAAKSAQNTIIRDNNREEFLNHLDGLVFASSEEQGVIRGNHFYHNKLDFTVTFPQDWRIENRPNSLLSTAKTNDTIIYMAMDDLNFKESADAYLRRNYADIEDLAPISTDSGLQGYAGVAKLKTPYGMRLSRIATVFEGKRAYVLISTHKDKGTLPGVEFYDTVRSVRNLKLEERQLAKGQRIRIVKAKPGDTFSKLARESILPNYAQAQLRLLNGMYPDGEPVAGQLIKIVE